MDCADCEDGAGDAEMVRKADLELELVPHEAEQLGVPLVVQEDRRAIAVEHPRGLRHDAPQQRRQLELGREIGDDVEELDLSLALAR